MILEQQLLFYLINRFYFSCLSTLTQNLKMNYCTCTWLQDSTVDSMDYPVVSAGNKQHFLEVTDGGTSLSEVLLSAEMIYL